MSKFQVVSEYQPAGDQPEAIAALAAGIENGLDEQTLLGVTGSGKTFTMAKVIEAVQRPTLVLAHNKTLAAQLCAEFKEFFPNNAVEYFVSYYDYYQPEAYIPHTDTFIEKDSAVNEEIDRLRLAATASLMERRDVIVVSSVSCIYGLGEPEDFAKMMVSLRVGTQMEREELLKKLVSIRYERNDIAFERLDAAVEDKQGKGAAEPDHIQLLEYPSAHEAAQQAAGQIGEGQPKVQSAPKPVDDGRECAQGEDNGDGRGEGAALLQSTPAGEEGHQQHPPAAPEKAVGQPGRSAGRRAAEP